MQVSYNCILDAQVKFLIGLEIHVHLYNKKRNSSVDKRLMLIDTLIWLDKE